MADVELLPLPSEFGHPSLQSLGVVAENYARANLAPLQAENEALRAEVEGLRADRDLFRDETITLARQNGEWQARADRLAEALRKLSADLRTLAGGETPDGDGVPVNVMLWAEKRLAALAQEDRNG